MILKASDQLPCGLCGQLFQWNLIKKIDSDNCALIKYLEVTSTRPGSCAVSDGRVCICNPCYKAISVVAIPKISAGNYVNRLFCQEYPEALKGLKIVEEAFIARVHVISKFLKLTSSAKLDISYRGSRGHHVALKQDHSNLLAIFTNCSITRSYCHHC